MCAVALDDSVATKADLLVVRADLAELKAAAAAMELRPTIKTSRHQDIKTSRHQDIKTADNWDAEMVADGALTVNVFLAWLVREIKNVLGLT